MVTREVGGELEAQNSQGAWVPLGAIKDVDCLRDELVEELFAEAQQLQEALRVFRQKSMESLKSFQELSSEKYGVKSRTIKGNQQFLSFNGTKKVELSVSEFLSFDERLAAAKELIDECIRDWSNGSRPELLALVNDAFKVDKKGKLAAAKILALRRLDIQGEKWRRAMDAIGDSAQVQYSKEYVRFYLRGEADYTRLALDIAGV